MPAKVLILDIETSPAVVYVWRAYKENVAPKQVIEHPTILSFAAKWLGDEDCFYMENRPTDGRLVKKAFYISLNGLLDIADIVVAQNGVRFDLPKIRGEIIRQGIAPFSPVKVVDTFLVARKEFGFLMNSLEYLGNVLDCDVKKKDHQKFPGFLLWKECLAGNEEAWEEMREYNIADIKSLEEIYLKMLPWMRYHPNVAIYANAEKPCCTKCGSDQIHYRGYAYTNVGVYRKFQCKNCGGWSRTRYAENKKNVNLLGGLVN